MLTITGLNLIPDDAPIGEQITFFDLNKENAREKREKLETAIDKIREKFGKNAVSIASAIKNDLGLDDPDGN